MDRSQEPQRRFAWLHPLGIDARAGFPVTKNLMVIGRDVRSDILINDPSVSKKHAQIIQLHSGFMLKDLDSRNGTFVNNTRIKEVYLSDGDMIQFGDSRFTFDGKVKPMMSDLVDLDVSMNIDLEMEKYETQIQEVTGTRRSGTRSSGTRFRDLSQTRQDPNSPTGTNTRRGPKTTRFRE